MCVKFICLIKLSYYGTKNVPIYAFSSGNISGHFFRVFKNEFSRICSVSVGLDLPGPGCGLATYPLVPIPPYKPSAAGGVAGGGGGGGGAEGGGGEGGKAKEES